MKSCRLRFSFRCHARAQGDAAAKMLMSRLRLFLLSLLHDFHFFFAVAFIFIDVFHSDVLMISRHDMEPSLRARVPSCSSTCQSAMSARSTMSGRHDTAPPLITSQMPCRRHHVCRHSPRFIFRRCFAAGAAPRLRRCCAISLTCRHFAASPGAIAALFIDFRRHVFFPQVRRFSLIDFSLIRQASKPIGERERIAQM